MRRRNLIIAAIIAVLTAAVTVPVAMSGGKPDPTFREALDKPKGPKDRLPRIRGKLAELVPNPDAARFTGQLAGHDVYLAPGRDDHTCLIDLVPDDAEYAGYACMPDESLKNTAAFAGFVEGGNMHLMVPVADAYDSVEITVGGSAARKARIARTLKPQNNVVLTTVPEADGTVRITGDDVPALEAPIMAPE